MGSLRPVCCFRAVPLRGRVGLRARRGPPSGWQVLSSGKTYYLFVWSNRLDGFFRGQAVHIGPHCHKSGVAVEHVFNYLVDLSHSHPIHQVAVLMESQAAEARVVERRLFKSVLLVIQTLQNLHFRAVLRTHQLFVLDAPFSAQLVQQLDDCSEHARGIGSLHINLEEP